MRLHLAIIAALVALIALLCWGLPARAHDPYRLWERPDTGGSCCSGEAVTGDCRRVRAYMHDDGLWRAQTPGGWLVVPRDKVLPFNAPDGNAHLCEKAGSIYCFAEPLPKI